MRLAISFLFVASFAVAQYIPPAGGGGGGGSGTVTSVTLAGTSNQITATGTCTGTTVINCLLSLPSGLVLPGTIDGLTITTTTGTLTITGAKVLTVSNSLTLAGTDGVTVTFPATNAVIARTDAAQTFTGLQTFSGGVATGSSAPSLTAGTGGATAAAEGTVPTVCAASGVDCLYADSTQHGYLANFNNAGYLPLVQGPTSATSGHIASFSGTNGGKLVDSGVVAANTVVASSPGAGIAHFAGSTQTATSSAIVNGDITNATIDLTTKVTGTLPVGNGGTGQTAPTAHGVIIGQGASATATTAAGTAGQAFLSGGASADGAYASFPMTSWAWNTASTTVSGSTYYFGGAGNATESARTAIIPETGYLKNLFVSIGGTETTGTLTCTVRTAAPAGTMTATAITFVIANGATTGNYSDTTHTAPVTQGDWVAVQCTQSTGTSAAVQGMSLSLFHN